MHCEQKKEYIPTNSIFNNFTSFSHHFPLQFKIHLLILCPMLTSNGKINFFSYSAFKKHPFPNLPFPHLSRLLFKQGSKAVLDENEVWFWRTSYLLWLCFLSVTYWREEKNVTFTLPKFTSLKYTFLYNNQLAILRK